MAKAKTSKQKKPFPAFLRYGQDFPGHQPCSRPLSSLPSHPQPSSAQTHLHSPGSHGRPIHHYMPHPSLLYHCSSGVRSRFGSRDSELTQTQLHWPTNSYSMQYWSQLKYLLQEATHDYPLWPYELCSVTQSCPTLCDPMNCSPPSSLSMEFSR